MFLLEILENTFDLVHSAFVNIILKFTIKH